MRLYLLLVLTIASISVAIFVVNHTPAVSGEAFVSLERARQAFPMAQELLLSPKEDPDFIWAIGEKGEYLGSLVISSPYSDHIIGYAGPTPLLIAINPEGKIIFVDLLPNNETPSYLRLLFASNFMGRWRGMDWRDAARETKDVDAVSSVTITSVAITQTLRHRLSLIDPEATIAPSPSFEFEFRLIDATLILITIFGFLLAFFPARFPKWFRNAQLAISALVLGFFFSSMISLALLGGWLRSGKIAEFGGLFFLVLSALVVPILFRKNFYCHFVCPFGALQEICFKITPFRIKNPVSLNRFLRRFRYGLLTLAALSLLLDLGLDLNDIEPFSAFRPAAAGAAALIIALITLIVSFFICRPWCNYLCPSGALLDLLRRPKIGRHGKERK